MRRTCEESLSARAWASAPRLVPTPALARSTEPSPAAQLRALLEHPGLRPVYYRTARKVLQDGYEAEILAEIGLMQREITRATDAQQMLQSAFPSLYPLLPCATASKPTP